MSCCSKKPTPRKDIIFTLFSFFVFLGMHAKFILIFLISSTSNKTKLFRFYLKFIKRSFLTIITKNSYLNKYFYKMSVITFQSTSTAIRAEKFILKNNLNSKIIPVPREISSTCTSALCIETSSIDKILKLFKNNNIKYISIRNLSNSNLKY